MTTNDGSTWTLKNPACFPLDTFDFGAQTLAMQPTNGLNSVIVTSSGVFITKNDWGTCSKATGTIPPSLAGATFDPFNPTTVWVWGAGTSKATFGSSFSAVTALAS